VKVIFFWVLDASAGKNVLGSARFLTPRSRTATIAGMGRPRGFDEDQVVRAAAELFAQHSYDGTSVDDLVKHLGVHRGSLYKTFGSKRGLYLRALRRHVDEDIAALARAVVGVDDQAEAVGLVLAAGPRLGMLFHAMVERAPIDPDAAAETTRALMLLDAATEAEGLTALALGQLLRRRAAHAPADPAGGGENAPAQREGEPSWRGSASTVAT
jgi:TetR/AcrR family transcriptional repressor of nem operon